MKESSKFDRIAFAYDFLSKLVFGNSIKKAQVEFLNQIPSGSIVLIIGGGTGWIINEIFMRSTSKKLIYVEASEKMLMRAKSKTKKEYFDKVEFIFGTQENVSELEKVEVIITFFFLDLFPEEEQKILCNKLLKHLKPQGLWMTSDFDYHMKAWWQKVLLKVMYTAFRIVCNIKASTLANSHALLEGLGLKLSKENFFYRKMIFSRIYHR